MARIMQLIFWMANNWIVVCGGIVLFLLLCWTVGYFGKAFYKLDFDLSSAWVGVGVFTAAGMLGFGKEIAVDAKDIYQFYIDSKYNTQVGEKPDRGA